MVIPDEINGKPVTGIGAEAFKGFRLLESVIIPSSVTHIGNNAFRGCEGLKSVSILGSVTYMGNSVFHGCIKLTSVTISEGVEIIGEEAFYGCEALTGISIPSSVTNMGSKAFYGCEKLESISIPSSVPVIGNNAFYQCSSLNSVTISEGVETIGKEAFLFCDSLEVVNIPASVTDIEGAPFLACESLVSINVAPSNLNYKGVKGVLFSIDGSILVQYPAGLEDESYVVPDGVAAIGYGAFGWCTSLESIIIPDSVTTIGERAFEECIYLESIIIPASVISMGADVFWYTPNLRDVIFLGNAPTVDSGTLSNDPGFTAWFLPGAQGFTTPEWMGADCEEAEVYSAPQDLTLTPFYDGVELSWGAPGNSVESDTIEYSIYVDGTEVGVVSDLSYNLALEVGAYEISVRANNRFGPGEPATESLDLGWAIYFTSPSASDSLRPGITNVEWEYLEYADIVSHFFITLNDDNHVQLDADARSHKFTLKVGSYLIELQAVDADDNSISVQNSFYVSADYDDGEFEYTLSGDYGDGPATVTGYIGTVGYVVIPYTLGEKTVVAIGEGAFFNSNTIINVTIPATVIDIGEGAFSNCSLLTDVYFLGDAPGRG